MLTSGENTSLKPPDKICKELSTFTVMLTKYVESNVIVSLHHTVDFALNIYPRTD